MHTPLRRWCLVFHSPNLGWPCGLFSPGEQGGNGVGRALSHTGARILRVLSNRNENQAWAS